MKRLLTTLALLAGILVPLPTLASGGSEHITEFAVVSQLSSANVLSVQETITIDYAGASHHGIYRTIPIVQRDQKDKYFFSFDLKSVTSPTGAPAAVASQSTSGDNEVIQIGDAHRTITGVQTYVITYTLSPVALSGLSADRVILNVTGQDWEYPIDNASLALTLPVASSSEPACYTGLSGSTDQNCTITSVGQTIQVRSNTILEPGEGLTVDTQLPAGSFSHYLRPNQAPPLSALELAGVILSLVTGIAAILVIVVYILGWWRRRHQRRAQTVYAQYESPDGLKPGEIGMLIDNKSGMVEFTATLIDLAVRGYLKITQTEKRTFGMTSTDYSFTKLKPSVDLTPYEQSVYSLIFASGDATVLSDITGASRSGENAAAIKSMRQELAADLKARGYYTPRSSLIYSGGWVLALSGAIAAFTGLSATGFTLIIFGLIGLSFVVAAAIALRWSPQLTPEGLAEWAKVDGFKLYLSMAEKDRLNFSDAPERTPERFNRLLPYAVALGVEKKWAQQFAGIDVTPANGWYAATKITMLNSAAFASTFASSFSGSVNSSFAGSSGDGMAGGGVGGGGGGGW